MAINKYILLVDDEPGLMRGLARFIRRDIPGEDERFELLVHEHPKTLLEEVAIHGDPARPATFFLISDGYMPDKNGDVLTEELRAFLGSQLRFVIIASSSEDFRSLAEAVKADLFLLGKPMQKEYWSTVKEHIERFLAEP